MTPRRIVTLSGRAIIAAALFVMWLLAASYHGPEVATGAPAVRTHPGERVTATWYGPGLYGNRLACANHHGLPERLGQRTRGVAHRTLPCGSWVWISHHGRSVHVQVIDRGPFSGATFDLTARTARDLCGCAAPYTMRVRWYRSHT